MGAADFAVVADRLEFRPAGRHSLEEVVRLVTEAIEEAKRRALIRLLVDGRGLDGFGVPTTLDRYNAVVAWAHAAGAAVRIAIVAREPVFDPTRFDVRLAGSLGAAVNVFVSEAEAVSWLGGAG